MSFIKDEESWFEDWQGRLIDWLEEEKLGSPMVVDRCWQVDEHDDGSIRANSYYTPFRVIIEPLKIDEERYIRVSIKTPVGTAMLEEWQRVEIYKSMLKINYQSELVKFTLEDIDDDVSIKAEFDLASLSKKEFDHGLRRLLEWSTFLFTSVISPEMFQEYIDEESWDDYEFYHVLEKLAIDIDEGNVTKDISVKRLKDIGYEEREATNLVEEIMDYLYSDEEKEGSEIDEGEHIEVL